MGYGIHDSAHINFEQAQSIEVKTSFEKAFLTDAIKASPTPNDVPKAKDELSSSSLLLPTQRNGPESTTDPHLPRAEAPAISAEEAKEKFIQEQIQEFKSSPNIDEVDSDTHLEALVRKGADLKMGESALMSIGGRNVFISKYLNPETKKVALQIDLIAHDAFAKGTFGEIRGATPLGGGENVVEKRAIGSTDEELKKAKEDVKKEFDALTKLKGKQGVQAPPFTVVTTGSEVIGYIGRRYDGDGEKVVEKMQQQKASQEKGLVFDSKEMIRNTTAGLKSVTSEGLYQFDIKLKNTLYKEVDGKAELVISDLGGVVDKGKLMETAEKYFTAVKGNNTDEAMTLYGDLHDSFNAITTATTCGNDMAIFGMDILELPNTNPGISKEEFQAEINKFMESRMVFSQALVSLALVTTSTEIDLMKDGVINQNPIGVLLADGNFEDFKARVLERGLATDVTDEQLKTLHSSLSSNYAERPTLDEFAKAW